MKSTTINKNTPIHFSSNIVGKKQENVIFQVKYEGIFPKICSPTYFIQTDVIQKIQSIKKTYL